MSENNVTQIRSDDDGGAVGRVLTGIFGRSYRTTIAGILSTASASIAAVGSISPGLLPHQVVALATALTPILLGGGLMVAKDARISGAPRP